jgi:hypothetical protein
VRAGAGQPAYAKIAGAVVLSFKLDAHPAFCRSLGKLQEPGAYSASRRGISVGFPTTRLHEPRSQPFGRSWRAGGW